MTNAALSTPHAAAGQPAAAKPVTAPKQGGRSVTTPGRLAAYGLIAAPMAMCLLALQVFVPTFYANNLGLSLASISAALLMARLFDMVTDPLIGWASDHTPARFGRRRLWVLVGTPLLMLSSWLLFNPPEGAGFWHMTTMAVGVYLFGTMLVVPYYSWGAEMSPYYHDRSRITGARVLAGLVGTLGILGLPVMLGTRADDLGTTLETASYLMMALFAVALAALVFFVPDKPLAPQATQSLMGAVQLFRRRNPLRQLLVSYLLNGTANGIPSTLFLFYVTHKLAAPEQFGMILFAYFLSAAIGVPAWVKIAEAVGKDRAWRAGVMLACVSFVWSPLLGPGDVWIFLGITIVAGFATGADLVLPASMQADLVDWDAAVHGKARPGIFFALWGTTTKLGFALAMICFALLQLTGFSPDIENSEFSLTMLGVLYGVLPVALKLAALWVMRGYVVTAQRHEKIRKRLAERDIDAAHAG